MKNLYTVLGRTAHKTHESERSLGSSFGKVTILILFLLSVNTELFAQCSFRIQLRDSYGDGWNGGVVTNVSVSGTAVLTNLSTATGTGWTNNGTFSAYNGQTIAITYVAGSWCSENTYRIQRNDAGTWNTVYTSGTCPSGTYTITNNGCTIALPGCTGTPNAGVAAISSSNGCAPSTISLSATSLSSGTGITYQWQSSASASGPWANITGATTSSYNLSSTAGTTYYKMVTTCSSSSTSNSSNVVSYTGVSCSSNNIPATGSTTIPCGSSTMLYDNGGASGDYTASNNGYTVLDNSGTGVITISGSFNYIETNWDYLRIYSGTGTGGTLLATYTNSTGGTITPYTSPAGTPITVQFTSDGSGQGAGFAMQVLYSGVCSSCNNPTALTSSSITGTSATISWTAASPAPASGYQYYVSTSSTAPTSGTTPTGTTAAGVTTASITGLTGLTTYYFWVRSNCGGSGTSSWSSSGTFTTICSGNSVVLNMFDSWGDGWNGATYTLVNNTTSATVASGTLASGSSGSVSFCLSNGCYQFSTSYDSYGEKSWNITVNGSAALSGGSAASSDVLSVNAVCAVTGCMDPASTNYNPLATIDDGSCYFAVPTSGSNSLTTCSATIYDNGGPIGDYAVSSNGTTTIYPGTPGQVISISFSTFTLETCCDNLKVYNGNSTAATLMGTYTTNPGTLTSTAADGSLTLQFYSDGSVQLAGFAGVISCVAPPPSCTQNDVTIAVTSGTYPGEVSWNLTNSSNVVVASGGAGSSVNVCLPNDCYTMNMFDSFGDGWNGATYTVSSGATTYGTGTLSGGSSGVSSPIGINSVCAAPWTDAWVSMNTGSSNWCAGETRTISVTVTNTGTSTWTNASPDINIGVKWNADADYFVRTDANGLAPGATQTYNLTVTAPLTAGSNNLTFDIVNEMNFWFANNTNGGGPGNVVYTSPAITIVASPTMNAGADQTVCEAASITLTDAGSGSTSLSWNNGVSNGVAFNAPSSTTTYTVTGTNAAGCTATDQVVVTVKPLPIVNAGADQTVCQGVIANLAGTVSGGSCIMSLTTSGGSFASEKWVNITTAANGGGTVVWAQGNGTIGNASGLLTNQSIDLSTYMGQTLYLNTYDAYDDGWDGSVYNLSFNGTTVINNGGASPSDGADTDLSSAWEAIAAEMETSEAFAVPALTYAWTSSPAGFTSSSLTASVSPTQTTTYTLSSTSNGCTGSDAVVVTLPTAGSTLANNNESATCVVNQNGWVHFYHSSGRLIGSINSQGQNLGSVTATSYVEGAPVSVDACTSSNPIYATTVMGRHWVITPTNQPSLPVLVRFPYSNTEFSDLTSAASTNANSNDDLFSPSDLGMTKYSNGTAANVNNIASDNCGVGSSTYHGQTGNGSAMTYSSVNANFVDFSIPGFSEFWLHGSSAASPLPVELVSFQANCQENGDVVVTWATASEHNSANFRVEYSRDGMNWSALTTVAGAGNSTQLINYSIIDVNAASGINYYRLTQTDFDGASETFNIVSSNCGSNESTTTVKVYPNPSAGDFYIDFNSEEITGDGMITITDARGTQVYAKEVKIENGSNVFHVELDAAPGMYYIRVSNKTQTSNIVKHSLR